jgi:hypothetical protein
MLVACDFCGLAGFELSKKKGGPRAALKIWVDIPLLFSRADRRLSCAVFLFNVQQFNIKN